MQENVREKLGQNKPYYCLQSPLDLDNGRMSDFYCNAFLTLIKWPTQNIYVMSEQCMKFTAFLDINQVFVSLLKKAHFHRM